jgi:hypothetical protein
MTNGRRHDHDDPFSRVRRAARSIAAGVALRVRAGEPRSSSSGFERSRFAALASIAVLGFLWLGRGLPRIPWLAPDTERYLELSPIRPHGYFWFLTAYRAIFDDLAHLPIINLGLS